MRPVTYIYDDLGVLDNAAGMVPLYLRDFVVMTPETGFDDEPIVLDAMPSTDHGDDFMDRIIAMLTDVPVVFTMSALIGERTDIESALAEPLSRATREPPSQQRDAACRSSQIAADRRLAPSVDASARRAIAPSPHPTWPRRCFYEVVTNNLSLLPKTTTTNDAEFYRETKWCEHCQAQVRYLASVNQSYCIDCGNRVRLFRKDEQTKVLEAAQRHRYQA
jgi:hypothetical protein